MVERNPFIGERHRSIHPPSVCRWFKISLNVMFIFHATLTTTEGFKYIGTLEVFARNDAVSAGNIPPGSGLPLARLNNAYVIPLLRFNTAWTPGKNKNWLNYRNSPT